MAAVPGGAPWSPSAQLARVLELVSAYFTLLCGDCAVLGHTNNVDGRFNRLRPDRNVVRTTTFYSNFHWNSVTFYFCLSTTGPVRVAGWHILYNVDRFLFSTQPCRWVEEGGEGCGVVVWCGVV